MPGDLRVFVPGETYELVLPVLRRERRLAPTAEVQGLLRTLLAALTRTPHLQVHAFGSVATHLHILATPLHPLAIPVAMREFKGTSARYLNRLQGCRGPLWQPYHDTPVSREAFAQLARLRYVLRHGEKEGLVTNVLDSPFANSARQLLGLDPRADAESWLLPMAVMAHATIAVRRAALRELLRADRQDQEAIEAAWALLKPTCAVDDDGMSAVPEISCQIRGVEAMAVVRSLTTGKRPVWRSRDEHASNPAPDRKSQRKPPVHAASREVRCAWVDFQHGVRQAYGAASEQFLGGDLTAAFPPCTLRPPCWTVGWRK